MGNGKSFLGSKRAGHKADHSFSSISKVKTWWNYTATPPQGFTACIRTTLSIFPLYLTIICALLFHVRKFKLLTSYLEPLFCRRTSPLPEFPCRASNISGLGCCITAIKTRGKRAAFASNKKQYMHFAISSIIACNMCAHKFFMTDGSIYEYERVIDFVKVNFKL